MKRNKSVILVVDDIQSNVEFIKDILAPIDDIEVHGLNTGPSTLKFLPKQKPDLILLDVSMPNMDGFEVCKRIKSDPSCSDIPIIF
jgi:CheY-like chemotaxis protein